MMPNNALPNDIIDEDITMHHSVEHQEYVGAGDAEMHEDEDEVEAFIKKRVKEGSGRDYESIVKKDIVNYQRIAG